MIGRLLKRLCADTLLGTALLLSAPVLPAFAASELTVYTAIIPEDRDDFAKAFNAHYPNIEIKWVGDSTGVITAKLLAEKDNPQADIVWGLAATSLLYLKGQDMLEPYSPTGVEELDSKFVDRSDPPSWVGMDAWVASVCVNIPEAEAANLPMPTSWEDLTDPVYKGHVVMPNPASSGTGYLDVSSWIQIFGEEDAWNFMDALHVNVDHYTHSGSKPCKQAASGEATIGISYMSRAAKLIGKGAPIELIVPSEGIGWDMEASAIMKGTDNLKGAQALMDFLITEEAMGYYNANYAVVSIPEIAKPVEHFPDNVLEMMIDVDFEWAAVERKRILKEWISRYDTKSEPKN